MKSIAFQKNHYVNVYDHGAFDIVLKDTGMYRCFPAIDGETIKPKSVKVAGRGDQVTVTFYLKNLDLSLSFFGENDRLTITPRISNLKGLKEIISVDFFNQASLVGYEKVLAHGYFSWDQSGLVAAGELEKEESYGMTGIVCADECLILGFLHHNQMMQSFTFTTGGNQSYVQCEAFLEGKDLKDVSVIEFSDLVVFAHASLDMGQGKWAQLVAKANDVKLTKPPIRGWCSWYYDYFWFSGEILEDHLEKFKPHKDEMNLNVFVMDANWFSHLGDWLETNRDFPEGLAYYAQQIAAAGYVPGLWISPWMVGDRSRLCLEHPDWLCHDEDGNLIEFMSPLGEDNVWGFRDKIHYCLDTSHPEAFAYVRNCFRTLRQWGFKYFKTDFMYWGAMDYFEGGWFHEGLNGHNFIQDKSQRPRIKRARPGKTRVEYFCDVLEMIRAEIGPETTWLGCGQPLWMSIGYVDAMRISRNVGARWASGNSPQELLNDMALRNFTNNVFYQVDPGCVLLRHFEHKLTDQEVTSLALLMGVSQGAIMTSDPVDRCKKVRRELFRFIQADDKIQFQQPLLGREDDWILYVGKRKDNGLQVVYALNSTQKTQHKTFTCQDLGLPAVAYVCHWRKEKKIQALDGELSLRLAPHQTTLLYVQAQKFKPDFKPQRISG
ncbi:glycoside hydrolase family 36 protein [Planctomycetota bacterium]